MGAVEAGHSLHIPFDLSSLEAEFLPLLEAWHLASPTYLPADSTSMSVKGPAFTWLLANLALAYSQEGIPPRPVAVLPVTAVWEGPTVGSQMGTANFFEPQTDVAGFTLGTSHDPNQIKFGLAATPVQPRNLGLGTFTHLTHANSSRPIDVGYLAGWLGFLTTAILLLAGFISVAVAMTSGA